MTTTSPISFPYPPFVIDTDVAIPLNQPLLDAAKFALDMSIDYRLKNDPREGAVARRFRSKIAPETNNGDLQSTPDIVVGYTGGALHRVVGARQLPDGNIEVSICMYDTPGLYTKFKDGRVVGPDPANPFTLLRPRVQWTDRPSADGSTVNQPRWLWLGESNPPDITMRDIVGLCEPFKPEPFFQKMPDPTSSS
ncbi:hypothetical protein JNN96_37890 [Mycobacterium sp. DSM 3803]|nr:hypothetical protein [Mycobacterium sp. DSM 3803]